METFGSRKKIANEFFDAVDDNNNVKDFFHSIRKENS